jgi:U3 small nucleolar ribonucleoprotein component
MTVSKAAKPRRDVSHKKSSSVSTDFSSLDTLLERIESLENGEDHSPEDKLSTILEDSELLTTSFKSLLNLMDLPASEDSNEEDFDSEKLDENIMEIMTEFLREGLVDEEDFEDFFIDELAESSGDEYENYGSEEDSSEEVNCDDSHDEEVVEDIVEEEQMEKSLNGKIKTNKHMRELEMLMAKVDDESDFEDDDDDDDEEEDEDNEIIEDEEDEEETGKKDMFGEDEQTVRLSSFERSQKVLKEQISALESENVLSEKPWSLRGEINARQRPSDSLLEEAVDFDNLSRPTPQITEERSEEIEDIIKRRISEAAWDDVVRKDGRDLTLLNGMQQQGTGKTPRALLEDVATAGPKQSLAQVYEDDINTKLSNQSPKDAETAQKEQELTAAFAKICRHIDGLSGNRFAPKVYVQSDFQIKTLGSRKI